MKVLTLGVFFIEFLLAQQGLETGSDYGYGKEDIKDKLGFNLIQLSTKEV